MAAIPQLDIAVSLFSTGYGLPVITEGDGSFTFANPGLQRTIPGAGNVRIGQIANTALFPGYNTNFGGLPETPKNYQLNPATLDTFDIVTVPAPSNQTAAYNVQSGKILVLDIGNIFGTGHILAKIQNFPGVVDYSSTGMVELAISNLAAGYSFLAVYPIWLSDGSTGWGLTAYNTNTNTYDVLMITEALTASWFPDTFYVTTGSTIPCLPFMLPTSPRNRQIDPQNLFSGGSTLSGYSLTFNILTGLTFLLLGSGEVPDDARNAFIPQSLSGQLQTLYGLPIGIFAVGYETGNTGCWYCAWDCSEFGQVIFTMDDASMGPSGSPTVYQVYENTVNFTHNQGVTWWPTMDFTNVWYWIRVPLVDGGGVVVLEPETGFVYSSSVAPPAVRPRITVNQIPPFSLPWALCGPCKKGML